MISITIPKIFFNTWFWFVLALTIIVTVFLIKRKQPTPPKPNKFFLKHEKSITRIVDIFLISIVLFGWLPIIYISTSIALESIFNTTSKLELLSESLLFALAFFLIPAIPLSGVSGVLVGCLSIFHLNLTKVKRIILLIISLLPIIFTILLLLINHTEKPEDFRLIIKLGLGSLAGCWLINGPAIIIGKHFLPVYWNIMRKLRLVSGDYPG